MFSESRIFLNNSGSKWLSIGIKPEPLTFSGLCISNFTTEILLCGEKCFDLALGGLTGVLQLMRQLRKIPFFKHVHTDVSRIFVISCILCIPYIYFSFCFSYIFQQKSSYIGNAEKDAFTIIHVKDFNLPVFKISKLGGATNVMLAFSTIELLLENERSIIRIITSKNATDIFNLYIGLMNKMVNDKNFDIRKAANTEDRSTNSFSFMDEILIHFNDLIKFDVKNTIEESKMVN